MGIDHNVEWLPQCKHLNRVHFKDSGRVMCMDCGRMLGRLMSTMYVSQDGELREASELRTDDKKG